MNIEEEEWQENVINVERMIILLEAVLRGKKLVMGEETGEEEFVVIMVVLVDLNQE